MLDSEEDVHHAEDGTLYADSIPSSAGEVTEENLPKGVPSFLGMDWPSLLWAHFEITQLERAASEKSPAFHDDCLLHACPVGILE